MQLTGVSEVESPKAAHRPYGSNDPALEAWIRGELGIPTGDLYYVNNNPLDCEDETTLGYIAELGGRGVNLVHDCD